MKACALLHVFEEHEGSSIVKKQCGADIGGTQDLLKKQVNRKLRRNVGKVSQMHVVTWAVQWMRKEYQREFWLCCGLIMVNAGLAAGLPLVYDKMFNDIMPRMTNGADCTVDFSLTASGILGLSLGMVWLTYKLDTNKMDGAGFMPLFQKDLCRHITQLPQLKLDGYSETDVLAMFEKDLLRLNQVISAFFNMLGAIMALSALLPVLFYLQWELACFCTFCIPFFVFFQFRQGGYVIAATEHLLSAENKFMRCIEENIVFATTRKVLGLGPALDQLLEDAQTEVVGRLQHLNYFQSSGPDISDARSTAQLSMFNLVMRVGVIGFGVYLITFVKEPVPADETPFLCLDEPQIANMSVHPNSSATLFPLLQPRLSIATLFSFLQGTDAIFPICLTIIAALRQFQVGTTAVARVLAYLNEPIDPWPGHAIDLQEQASFGSDLKDDHVEITVVKAPKHSRMAMSVKRNGVISKVDKSGLAARSGLLVGDKILSIDGHRLMGGQVQADHLLSPTGVYKIIVVRNAVAGNERQVDQLGAEDTSGCSSARRLERKKIAGQRIDVDLHVDNKKLFINSIEPSSPFAGRLRVGDELLDVNGTPVKGLPARKVVAMIVAAAGTCMIRVRQTRGLVKMARSSPVESLKHRFQRVDMTGIGVTPRVATVDVSAGPKESKAAAKYLARTHATPVSRAMQGSAGRYAIAAGNVSVGFGSRDVLENCDLMLPAGATACILGRSGGYAGARIHLKRHTICHLSESAYSPVHEVDLSPYDVETKLRGRNEHLRTSHINTPTSIMG